MQVNPNLHLSRSISINNNSNNNNPARSTRSKVNVVSGITSVSYPSSPSLVPLIN